MTHDEVVSLREYIEQRLTDLERLIRVELELRDRALRVALDVEKEKASKTEALVAQTIAVLAIVVAVAAIVLR